MLIGSTITANTEGLNAEETSAETTTGPDEIIEPTSEETLTIEKYQYVLFAGGESESLKLSTNNLTINGDSHTNGTFVATTKNAKVNGEIGVWANKMLKVIRIN